MANRYPCPHVDLRCGYDDGDDDPFAKPLSADALVPPPALSGQATAVMGLRRRRAGVGRDHHRGDPGRRGIPLRWRPRDVGASDFPGQGGVSSAGPSSGRLGIYLERSTMSGDPALPGYLDPIVIRGDGEVEVDPKPNLPRHAGMSTELIPIGSFLPSRWGGLHGDRRSRWHLDRKQRLGGGRRPQFRLSGNRPDAVGRC